MSFHMSQSASLKARRLLVPALVAAAALLSGCIKEAHVSWTINEDGSSKVVSDTVMDRQTVERQVEAVARFEEEGFAGEEVEEMGRAIEGGPPATEPAPQPPKTDNRTQAQKDTDLAASVRKLIEEQSPVFQADQDKVQAKLETVEVKADTVRIVWSAEFKELKTLVTYSPLVSRDTGFGGLRLEKDNQGKLRLTLSGTTRTRQWAQMRELLVSEKFKGSYRFVMPGKVIASSLPEVKDNTTALEIDAAKPETLDALQKVMTDGIVITAEPGKLDLAAMPLDSAELGGGFGEAEVDADLPLVDAVPGYVAEALSVTTSTVHYFPEAAKAVGDELERMLSDRENVCRVRARLMAPRSRGILTLNGVRVIKAVDEKDREVKGMPTENPDRYSGGSSGGDEEGKENRMTQFDLLLELPQADAEAIEELQGEAVVTSFGRWKEHVIEDPKADPKAEIDLGDVLPGAKMVVVRAKPDPKDATTGTFTLRLTGPKDISRLEFKVRLEGIERVSSYVNGNSTRRSGANSRRNATLTYNFWDEEKKPGKATLVIRYPDDLKRERVKFTLEALDLF